MIKSAIFEILARRHRDFSTFSTSIFIWLIPRLHIQVWQPDTERKACKIVFSCC